MLACWIKPTLRFWPDGFLPSPASGRGAGGEGAAYRMPPALDTTNSFVQMLACWIKPTALLDVVPCCTTPLSYSLPMRGERAKTLGSDSAWAWLAALAVKHPTASFQCSYA